MGIKFLLNILTLSYCVFLFGESPTVTTGEVVQVISGGKFVYNGIDRRAAREKKQKVIVNRGEVLENLLCLGVVTGRTITIRCMNKNATPFVIKRNAESRYWLTYSDIMGKSHQIKHNGKVNSETLQIEVLSSTADSRKYRQISAPIMIQLPLDCAKVDSLEVELEGTIFPSLGMCASMYELEKLFVTNAFHKIVILDSIAESVDLQ